MHTERFVRALVVGAALVHVSNVAAQSTPNVHTATPQSSPTSPSGHLRILLHPFLSLMVP